LKQSFRNELYTNCFSENIEERESQFSRIVSARSYSPEEIPNVLRNRLTLGCEASMLFDFS